MVCLALSYCVAHYDAFGESARGKNGNRTLQLPIAISTYWLPTTVGLWFLVCLRYSASGRLQTALLISAWTRRTSSLFQGLRSDSPGNWYNYSTLFRSFSRYGYGVFVYRHLPLQKILLLQQLFNIRQYILYVVDSNGNINNRLCVNWANGRTSHMLNIKCSISQELL